MGLTMCRKTRTGWEGLCPDLTSLKAQPHSYLAVRKAAADISAHASWNARSFFLHTGRQHYSMSIPNSFFYAGKYQFLYLT